MLEGIEFFIKKITTEQFAVVEGAFKPDIEINLIGDFKFSIGVEDKAIIAFSNFRFEQESKSFLVIEVSCQFVINEQSWETFKTSQANQLTVDKGFVTHLLALTVGATRGVLHAKTENSIFNQYLLPSINLSNSVTEDITFSF